ncbi:unnamed protein product, partial [Phaeothamnion confervicola]
LAASEAGLGDQLPPVARDFIAASKDSVDREVAARRRRTRLTITGLTVALVAVASGAGFALVQRDRAAGQRDIARSQGLAAQAEEVVGQAPETAVQLAEQALDTRDTAAAQLALRQATFNEPLRRTVRTPGDTALGSIAVSDAGEVVASSDGGDVLAW